MGFVIPRARAPIATVRCSCKGVGKHPGALDPLAHSQEVDEFWFVTRTMSAY
jgi:hypothetical protein